MCPALSVSTQAWLIPVHRGSIGYWVSATGSRSALQPSCRIYSLYSASGVKRPGREAHHATQFSTKVKTAHVWLYSQSPMCLYGVVLNILKQNKKQKEKLEYWEKLHLTGVKRKKCSSMKVPRQYPLVLLVKVGWRDGKAFGSWEGRAMRTVEKERSSK
jgi:hypothetical protein